MLLLLRSSLESSSRALAQLHTLRDVRAFGAWLAAITQILNAVGALTIVYAFRYGKAMVVAPLTNAGAPLITALIALALLGIVPQPLKLTGIVLAFAAAALLAIEPEEQQ